MSEESEEDWAKNLPKCPRCGFTHADKYEPAYSTDEDEYPHDLQDGG